MTETPNPTLLLNPSEMAALLNLVFPQDEVAANVDTVLPGASSLMDRGLVSVDGEEAQLSPKLVAVIEPVLTCAGSLTVAALAGAEAEDYFFSGERAVRRRATEGEANEFRPMPSKEAPAAIAASLKAQAVACLREPAIPEIAELSRFADLFGEEEVPKPHSAAGLVLSRPNSEEQIVTVLLHERGFTWIEAEENPRVAYVDTEEELAELIASLISACGK